MCSLLCLNYSTSHPLSSFWLNPLRLSTSFRKLSLISTLCPGPTLFFPAFCPLLCRNILTELSGWRSAARGQRVPLIPAFLDSELAPGTRRYTTHIVEFTCRWGTFKKGHGRRELLNFGLSKRVFQTSKKGKVIWGEEMNCMWQDERQGWGKHGSFKGLAEMPMARDEADDIHIAGHGRTGEGHWAWRWHAQICALEQGSENQSLWDQFQLKITQLQREGAGDGTQGCESPSLYSFPLPSYFPHLGI